MKTMQERVNTFLDIARESGKINMFGAAPYIAETFGISRREAQQYLLNWMQSFKENNHGS